MTLIDFYKNLSSILTELSERRITKPEAEDRINELLSKSEDFDLDISIDIDSIIDEIPHNLDDEKPFGYYDLDYDSY